EEELVLVSSAGWKNLQEIGQRMQQGAAAIMFRAGCAYRLKFEQILSEQGWPYYARMEMGTVEGMLGCVAAEAGITLLPRAVAQNAANRSQLRCHLPGRAPLRVQTVFITRRDEAPSQALRQLLRLL
ncbi:MAG TPA: LysR substrate-binding domain-containing protein, partial [Ramlibacter sp.]|nr:LysR substrate-binding domain-containing protein [Ramlibacter sp.]